MSVQIVGIKNVDFTPKGEEPIKGFSIFIVEDDPDDKKLYGVVASKIWAKPEMMASAMTAAGLTDYAKAVGRPVELRYNKYGKPDKITIGK